MLLPNQISDADLLSATDLRLWHASALGNDGHSTAGARHGLSEGIVLNVACMSLQEADALCKRWEQIRGDQRCHPGSRVFGRIERSCKFAD